VREHRGDEHTLGLVSLNRLAQANGERIGVCRDIEVKYRASYSEQEARQRCCP
jgi:hypothetical protein